MRKKKVKCPECHGDGYWFEPILWKGIGGGTRDNCDLCKGIGKVSQKLRMEYVRRFKDVEKN